MSRGGEWRPTWVFRAPSKQDYIQLRDERAGFPLDEPASAAGTSDEGRSNLFRQPAPMKDMAKVKAQSAIFSAARCLLERQFWSD
jgi:hypothetical protein